MKSNFIEFYVNKFNFINNIDDADVSFLSPIVRRRLGGLDKGVILLLNRTKDDNVQNIVFASRSGEFERLIKIIAQYTENNEVSPNIFTGSVHNYPVGFFLMNEKKTIPYTALSAVENSISAGIMSAVVSKFDNNLFCYADIINCELIAFALYISKNHSENSQKYRLIIRHNESHNDDYKAYKELFGGLRLEVNSKIFSVEKVKENA